MIHTPPIHTSISEELQLNKLKRGQQGRIVKIEDERVKTALLKMGISEGDECVYTGCAPLRDPVSMLVGRTKVSIRKRDAARIWIVMK